MKIFLLFLSVSSLHLFHCLSISVGQDQLEAAERQIEDEQTYMEMFMSSIGSSLISLLGIRARLRPREDINTSFSEPLTPQSQASPVSLPLCEAEGGQCLTVQGETLSCGRPYQEGRVVNGSQASAGSHPWAVQMMLSRARGKILCAGSLITNRFLVTAAHCFNRVRPADILLVLGNLRSDGSSSPDQELRKIEAVYIREDFDEETYNNDIAVVSMDRRVQFTAFIRPLCLPEINEDYAGSVGTIVGWGRLSHNGRLPDSLQESRVPVLSQETCRYDTNHLAEEITEGMMCAGYQDTAATDACQGDSGGPLILPSQSHSHKLLVGIVSWGIDCAKPGYPGVYTRVGTYLHWIRDIVSQGDSCFCRDADMEVKEEPEREESKESLQQEIERLREQLTLLAQRGGQVIVELTSKLEAKDEKIVQLEGTIRKLNSTIELSV